MLRKQTTALINAITPCLNQVATEMQRENLITLDMIGRVMPVTGLSPIEKARQLVTNLQFSLNGHPSPDKYLMDVCKVLCSQGDKTLREIVESIQQNLGK